MMHVILSPSNQLKVESSSKAVERRAMLYSPGLKGSLFCIWCHRLLKTKKSSGRKSKVLHLGTNVEGDLVSFGKADLFICLFFHPCSSCFTFPCRIPMQIRKGLSPSRAIYSKFDDVDDRRVEKKKSLQWKEVSPFCSGDNIEANRERFPTEKTPDWRLRTVELCRRWYALRAKERWPMCK